MKAIIYTRVSTDVQLENYSIPGQLQACAAYADKKGYVLVGDMFYNPDNGKPDPDGIPAYVDGHTSLEISRPGLDAVMAYLDTSGFDVMIVYVLNRLARDPYTRETIERKLRAKGAAVEYVLGQYDESAQGEIRKDLDALFAKWENVERVERSVRGKIGKAKAGKFPSGSTPLGYEYAENEYGLAIVEEEAEIIRKIFDYYLETQSIYKTTKRINEEKLPAKRGGKWGRSSVARVLRNTIYTGYYHYNKHKRVNGSVEKRPREEWIRIESPPLIDAETFEAVEKLRKHNRSRKRRKAKYFYLLQKTIECDLCGMLYVCDGVGRGRKVYRHRKRIGHCRNHVISGKKIEAFVWDEVKRFLLEDKNISEGMARSGQIYQDTRKTLQKKIEAAENDLRALANKIENLDNTFFDPRYKMTEAQYIKIRTQSLDEIEEAKEKLVELERQLRDVPQAPDIETVEMFRAAVQASLITGVSKEKKRAIIEGLGIRVRIGEDKKPVITY